LYPVITACVSHHTISSPFFAYANAGKRAAFFVGHFAGNGLYAHVDTAADDDGFPRLYIRHKHKCKKNTYCNEQHHSGCFNFFFHDFRFNTIDNFHLTSFSKLVIAKELLAGGTCGPFFGFSVAFFSFTQGFWFEIDYIH
jgi:hypothetical protein